MKLLLNVANERIDTMITAVITQPTYLPWLGYFRIMKEADIFVLLDHVQSERRSWQNRNKVKGPGKWMWLTVPTRHTETLCPIKDVTIDSTKQWQRVHLKALETCYRKAPYFDEHYPFFKSVYERSWTKLAELNIHVIKYLASQLGLSPIFVRSSELKVEGKRTQLLYEICKRLEVTRYVSSIGAMDYMKKDYARGFFKDEVLVQFLEYNHPTYQQLFGDFVPNLSFVDCLFNCGPESPKIVFSQNTAIFHSLD